ncbi:condensation domain-containing protein [Streptomyces sp. NBC_00249]|uniref:condensation domain-containing protein n=1 Tax=Streptomyces sp. NBC_00249 TaxID=2975690 RepID=UPI0022595CDE|nr:condensation domain-containing protein [Streptomyces sp. NBC_00249]MCX5195921.1 condensation domain-containing protein [Streptomyces sp. NBC_00249]
MTMHHQGQETAPLTFPQLSMFQALRDDMGAMSTIEVSYRIDGPLDVAAFIESVGEVIRSHDALRLAVCECGGSEPHQWVRATPPLGELVTCQKVKASSEERFSRYVVALATKDAAEAWDPRTELPFRLRLLQYSPGVHAFIATFSQLAVDGSVRAVFGRELWRAYRRRRGDHDAAAEPTLQFMTLAAGRDHAPIEAGATADFWRRQFARLPQDRDFLTSTTPETAEAGITEKDFVLEGERLHSMRTTARSNNATELIWIQHALASTVFDHTDADSLALWIPVDTRSIRERRLLGMLTLSLPLVVDRGATSPELVRALTDDWLAVLKHRRVTREIAGASGAAGLGKLVGGPERAVRIAYVGHPQQTVRTPLNDLVLSYGAYAPSRERAVAGVHLKVGSWTDRVEFHLTFNRARITDAAAQEMTADIERLLVG